jgi:hypothetical protein
MKIGLKQITLIGALALAALGGACGPSTPQVDDPSTKGGTTDTPPAGAGTTATPPGDTTSTATTPPPTTTGDAATPPPAPIGAAKNVPLVQSKFIADLKGAGINTAKIPEIGKIPLAQKKKIMPFMQKAMGYTACTGCHVEGDFKAETRNLKISRQMWNAYTVPMLDEKGGPVFCDTCHSGQVKVLNRADKEAVKKFMEDEYEHKLTRADKKDMECSTCHGDTMELKIIENLWKIPAK